ncbi:beta-ketoacyl synthase N-terminal-like domain-containing protein [Streptomyces sp. MMS24-I2-30]|uniref:beta-ketoacyl synthase N-terminal-like domain-containing protein n=1 Tax=Streptomyces sp. MMS24-I2-30 TaxID=3351564 RepID=UPI003896B73D
MSESRAPDRVPVAVVGLAALLPGASHVQSYWRNVVAGKDLLTDVPSTHWLVDDYYDPDPSAPDKTYCRRGGFLPEVDFDPLLYGIPPATLSAIDPTQLLGLVVADRLLADTEANLAGPLDRERIGVILGSGSIPMFGTMAARIQRPVWLRAMQQQGIPEEEAQAACDRIADQFVPWQESSFPGMLSNVIAGRIASRFDLHGINCTVDAACASSLAALSAAVNELALGHADVMFTGGADTLNNPLMYVSMSKTPALSPSGEVRPFDTDADGTVIGEGLGMVALKRLADAERDGDRVYAVLGAVGASSDGRGSAIYAPEPQGQARALRRAYEIAGYSPTTVELVEAHGTGTRAGDAAEFAALREVFAADSADTAWCALGSVKSQIGHTKAAAGAAGLIKVVLALHHKVLPPTIKVTHPNPTLEIEKSPFYLNTRARPWIRADDHPRRASLSAFGFGGSNYHVTVEEYRPQHGRPQPARYHALPQELLLFSGASLDALRARARQLLDELPFVEAARESRRTFDRTATCRLALVAADATETGTKLDRFLALRPDKSMTAPGGVSYSTGEAEPGPLAFLFPGQGSQYPGMGSGVAMAFPAARAVWDQAARLELGPIPLHQVVFPQPGFSEAERAAQHELLTRTEWAQPALAAHSLSLLAVLDVLGLRAQRLGGHSLGELVSLHAANVYDADTLLRLTRRRGVVMGSASEVPGGMLAVNLPLRQVEAELEGVEGVWVANHNQPEQVVVSGEVSAVEQFEARLTAQGVRARRLDVVIAAHTPLVASANAALHDFLAAEQLSPPVTEVWSNLTAEPYGPDLAKLREMVSVHGASPVQFVDQIEAMYAAGSRIFVEVGAGSAITGMIGSILGERPHLAINLDRKGACSVESLLTALGRLAVNGVELDFEALWPTPDPAVRQPGPAAIKINGSEYGRPYPPSDADPVAPVRTPDAPVRTPAAPSPAVLPAESRPEPAAVPASVSFPYTSTEKASTPMPQYQTAPDPDWLQVLAETQRQTAQAQAAFQQALLTGHQSYLQLVDNMMGRMGGPADAGEAAPATGVIAPLVAPVREAPPQFEIPVRSAFQAPAPELMTPPASPVQSVAPQIALPTVQLPAVPPVAAPVAAPVVAAPEPPAAVLSAELLLGIVAETTGYPVELLGSDMDLESELGVDSIKKVQILSALWQRVPGLNGPDSPGTGSLFKLRTVDAIVEQLAAGTPGTGRHGKEPGGDSAKEGE